MDCDRVSQAWMPSTHVCPRFALPALPQFLNQEPPRPQQLVLPDFPMVPHLGHTGIAVTPSVHMCGYWPKYKEGDMQIHSLPLCSKLTFAGIHTFKPPVINVPVASTSAVLIPSTARSATTSPAGFLERAALWARHPIIARDDGWRSRVEWYGDRRADYKFPFRNWPTF